MNGHDHEPVSDLSHFQSYRTPTSGKPASSLQSRAGNTAIADLVRESTSGAGRPLDDGVRAEMEGHFGQSFDDVRIHTGPNADRSARALRAHAYTAGSDIVFRDGAYDTRSREGRYRLAHELVHVLQQRSGQVDSAGSGSMRVSDPSDPFERYADEVALRVLDQATRKQARPATWTGDSGATRSAARRESEGIAGVGDFSVDAGRMSVTPLLHIGRANGGHSLVERAASPSISQMARGIQRNPLARRSISPSIVLRETESQSTGLTTMLASGVATGLRWTDGAGALVHAVGILADAEIRSVIRTLAATNPEALTSYVQVDPSHPLVPFVLRQLSSEQLGGILRDATPYTARMLLQGLQSAGHLALIMPGLLTVKSTRLRDWLAVAEPLIRQSIFELPEGRELALALLKAVWPVGLGVSGHLQLGVTAGWPRLAGDEIMSLTHGRPGEIELMRRGEYTVGAETGISAGGYFALGGRREGRNRREGGLGGGFDAGGDAGVGLRQIMQARYAFPVLEDRTFLPFMVAMAGVDTHRMTGPLLRLWAPILPAIDPLPYNTLMKFEFKLFAEGEADAKAGLRRAGEDTVDGVEVKNGPDRGAIDIGESPWYLRFLDVGLFAELGLDLAGGVDIEPQGRRRTVNGPEPEKIDISFYLEGGVLARIGARLPGLLDRLGELGSIDDTVGVKLTWTLVGEGTDVPVPENDVPDTRIYHKAGELDYYAGSGSETEARLAGFDFNDLESFLGSLEGDVTVRRRLSLAGSIGSKFAKNRRLQSAVRSKLPAEYKNRGLVVEGYFDLVLSLTSDQFRQIYLAAYEAAQATHANDVTFDDVYSGLAGALNTGEAPSWAISTLRRYVDIILASLRQFKLHGRIGIGVATGAKVAAGAKGRLDVAGDLLLTIDVDLLSELGGDSLEVSDIERLIGVPERVSDEPIEFPASGTSPSF